MSNGPVATSIVPKVRPGFKLFMGAPGSTRVRRKLVNRLEAESGRGLDGRLRPGLFRPVSRAERCNHGVDVLLAVFPFVLKSADEWLSAWVPELIRFRQK